MSKGIVIRKAPTIIIVSIAIAILLFLSGMLVNSRFLMLIGIFELLFVGFVNLRKEFYFCAAFLVTMFTFLLGRIFVNWIIGSPSLLTGAFIYDKGPTDYEMIPTLAVLLLSLIFFILGVFLVPGNKAKQKEYQQSHLSITNKRDYSQACLILFYVTICFELVVSVERFAFLLIGGSYTSYYTSFARSLPSFIYKVAELNMPAFFAVLACRISKKKTMPVMVLFLLDGFIVLLGGQRNQFVRAAVFVLCYMLIRRREDSSERWLTDRQLRIILFSIPLAIIALQAWGTMRNGTQFSVDNMIQTLLSFFQDQGSTSVVIQKGIELEESFPVNTLYSLSAVENFLQNNIITKIFYQAPVYAQQTTELALYGNNYGATLTYLYIPHNYAVGIGMGTSFVAEVFHDFGYIGIAIISVLYAVLLVKLENRISNRHSMWKTMILLLFADGILYAPRDSTLNFLTNGLNFTVLLFACLVVIFNVMLKTGERK